MASSKLGVATVTGGTLYTSGGFNYRVFTGNGTLTVSGAALTADVLVIAGGGGEESQKCRHHAKHSLDA